METKIKMQQHIVKPSPQYVKLIKCNVIRANARWQEAEPHTKEEDEAEEKLRIAVDKLLQWCPEYDNKGLSVAELDFMLKQELKWGKDIAVGEDVS